MEGTLRNCPARNSRQVPGDRLLSGQRSNHSGAGARGLESRDRAVRVTTEKTTQAARLGSLWVEVTMLGLEQGIASK